MVRGLDRFDERSSFKTWAYRVATNAALDELRRRRRRPEPGLPVAALTSRGTDAALDQGVATRLDVDAALARLPTEFRAPVVLRDLCTLSYDEIAEVLDIPPGTVRSRIARGRAALADMLRDDVLPGPSRARPGTRRASPTVQTLPMSDLHPDDEALSAHLDGEDLQPRDHLDGCDACAARLGELRRARDALAAPVPPPPAWQRDAAVARALVAVGQREGSRRKLGPWAGGIAAALLLVLGAAVGLAQLSNRGGGDTASSRATKAAGSAAVSGGPTPTTSGAASDLGDLGALPDTAALRAVIQPTLQQLTTGAAKAAPAAPAAAPPSAAGDRTLAQARGCVGAARALDPANVSPTAAGIATWQGTPAEVLVYALAGRPGAARVYVLARADCRVLEFQSYAP